MCIVLLLSDFSAQKILNPTNVTHFPGTLERRTASYKNTQMSHCAGWIYKAIEKISIYPLRGSVCCRYFVYVCVCMYGIRVNGDRFSIMMKIYTCALQVTWLCQKMFSYILIRIRNKMYICMCALAKKRNKENFFSSSFTRRRISIGFNSRLGPRHFCISHPQTATTATTTTKR